LANTSGQGNIATPLKFVPCSGSTWPVPRPGKPWRSGPGWRASWRRCSSRKAARSGQLISVIDQRPYKAALQDARGQLAQAQAAFGKANKDVERLRPLVAAKAAPAQDLDRAESEAEFSLASIEKGNAAVARAELDLKFTEVRASINGIIGRAEVTVGNLVARDRTLLTTISSWEPMRVVFSISESDYLS